MGAALSKLSQTIVLIFFIVTISACGSETSNESDLTVNNNHTSSPEPTLSKSDPLDDENIAESIYLNIRVPDDFYHEPERDRSNFYTITHIKNYQVNDIEPSGGTNTQYELCSQDFSQALEWSEQAASNQATYHDLVDNSDTSIFYEFTRVDNNAPSNIRLSRIFKCDSFNKAIAALSGDASHLGNINVENISSNNIKNLIDYLWTMSPHNNFGYAILNTKIEYGNTGYTYTMDEARISSFGGSGACDTIVVDKIIYTINQSTGMISVTRNTIKTISATVENNTYRLCE